MDTGRTEARFTRSDALALAAGCVLAFIWRRSVALLGWYESREAPAAGALIFAAAAWAIVPLLLRKRARLTRGGLFAAVMSLALEPHGGGGARYSGRGDHAHGAV